MGLTAFHKPTPHETRVALFPLRVPAVAVFYGASGVQSVDALVLNAPAAAALERLAGARPAIGCEVEMLYDPATTEFGVRPWVIGRPTTTLHHVHPTRFAGGTDPSWGERMRVEWPVKVEAPQFLACWGIPAITAARPALARVRDGAIVADPRELVHR